MNESAPLIVVFEIFNFNLMDRWASSSNHLWIRFISDHSTIATGFSLEWIFVNETKGIKLH